MFDEKMHPFSSEKKSTLDVVSLDCEFLQVSIIERGPPRCQLLPSIFDFLSPRRNCMLLCRLPLLMV
jgi:hypothetical protein